MRLGQRLMGEGAQLTNFFVNTPICCPSRTAFFSGRYFHNVGPPSDTAGKCMHADTSFASSNATGLFGALTRHGYNTGVFGKVTNDQQHILDALVAARRRVRHGALGGAAWRAARRANGGGGGAGGGGAADGPADRGGLRRPRRRWRARAP